MIVWLEIGRTVLFNDQSYAGATLMGNASNYRDDGRLQEHLRCRDNQRHFPTSVGPAFVNGL